MFDKAVILGIYSVTPVHAGSGAELSVIDLPIQREKHTQFPIIWGQSLKGVLKNNYRNKNEDVKTDIIFGPENDGGEHASAISVGDAKILLFPVRSLKGVFAYVTCPMILKRFQEDLELAGIQYNPENFDIRGNNVIIGKDTVLDDDGQVILEDILLKVYNEQSLPSVVDKIPDLLPIDIDTLNKRLAVVSDDLFKAVVTMNTEVIARTRINTKKGTVETGGLWYEEFLPSDTVLYSTIAVGKPKKDYEGLKSAEDILKELNTFFSTNNFLQIGGDETVGKGYVKVKACGCNT